MTSPADPAHAHAPARSIVQTPSSLPLPEGDLGLPFIGETLKYGEVGVSEKKGRARGHDPACDPTLRRPTCHALCQGMQSAGTSQVNSDLAGLYHMHAAALCPALWNTRPQPLPLRSAVVLKCAVLPPAAPGLRPGAHGQVWAHFPDQPVGA